MHPVTGLRHVVLLLQLLPASDHADLLLPTDLLRYLDQPQLSESGRSATTAPTPAPTAASTLERGERAQLKKTKIA